MQLVTFYRIWKRDYGHIKVSRAVEDICALCYQLANRHRYFVGTCNSSVDVSLFCEDCADNESPKFGDQGEGDDEDDAANEISIVTEKKPKAQPSVTEKEPEAEQITTSELMVDAGDVELIDVETLDRENMLIRAAKHVRMAQVQRLVYVQLVHKARQHARLNLPHSMRSYTFVCDYGQNMELPIFNHEQPGCSYYFSPLSVYNFGVVDQAYIDSDGEIRDHMHAHVYHEGVGKKGANNVCSLIVKTLRLIGILRENDMGGELNIVFDNCSGQNKNNTVLKLLVWLTEMGYFRKINFVFLIVGHTKNAADRIFNLLKVEYQLKNLSTMVQLVRTLDKSKHVTIHTSATSDFVDWNYFLDLFYRDFTKAGVGGLIKSNHIFSCNFQENRKGNNVHEHIRESDLPEHVVYKHKTIKSGFFGRSDFP